MKIDKKVLQYDICLNTDFGFAYFLFFGGTFLEVVYEKFKKIIMFFDWMFFS